ncbi:MAG: COX15/CtaA family protein [Polyangiaceae bacterium]
MTPHDPAHPLPDANRRLARLAWLLVWFVGAVILFGAVVRVTGSGAGCGVHWPTCQGEVFHLPRRLETAIELFHRVTSGLSFLGVVALGVVFARQLPRGHAARRWATWAILFIVVESLIGAVLVLYGLVVGDRSVARAFMVPVHLANASLLMASLVLAARAATHPVSISTLFRASESKWCQVLLGGLLVTSMLGAVTALGDTLFPPDARLGVSERLFLDQGTRAHFLERMRIVHPAVALLVSGLTIRLALGVRLDPSQSAETRRLSTSIAAVTAVQVAAGTLNVWLRAPAPMQIVHLGFALALFCLVVLLWAQLGEQEERSSHAKPSTQPRPSKSPITAP